MPSLPYLDHTDIHVVFSRNNWIDPTTNGPISATDYGLISPVLRHASEILDHPNAASIELERPYEAGVRRNLRFPVKMTHVGKMFTGEFWEREVVQYGTERLRVARSRVIDWGEIGPERQVSV